MQVVGLLVEQKRDWLSSVPFIGSSYKLWILLFYTIPRLRIIVNFCLSLVIDNNHFVTFCIKAYTTLFSSNILPSITFNNITYIK